MTDLDYKNKKNSNLRLISSTIKNLSKKGINDLTMNDVSQGAGLSQGIVNFHFKSKELLLIETLKFISNEYLTSFDKYLKKEIAYINPQMIANITVMFVYKNLPNLPISSIRFNDELLGWAANENSKERFKSKEALWTIQCNQTYSKKIIDKFKSNNLKYMKEIAKRFEKIIGISSKDIIFKSIHGWRYAFSSKKTKLGCVWNKKYRLGVCADWFLGNKAEDAWMSAHSLYKKIK